MADKLNLLLIQFDVEWESPISNLAKIEKMIGSPNARIDVIVLPEMFNTGFSMKPERIAVTYDHEVIGWMQNISNRNKALVIGSVAFAEDGSFFNRLVAVYPDGNISYYDKRHLFRMAGENKKYKRGNKQVVMKFRDWRIAPFICYDLRFPVWSRNRNDYDLAVYVANWPASRSETWKTLLKARAIENQCYVVGVNRVGSDEIETYDGNTLVADFNGTIIASANDREEEVVKVTLDFKQLNAARESFPVWMDSDDYKLLL